MRNFRDILQHTVYPSKVRELKSFFLNICGFMAVLQHCSEDSQPMHVPTIANNDLLWKHEHWGEKRAQ